MSIAQCTINGCGSKHRIAKGLCNKHYIQMARHGHIFTRTYRDKNAHRLDGDITYIRLDDKHCKPVAEAIIDSDDFDRAKSASWSISTHNYVVGYSDGRLVKLHRFIMNAPEGLSVDHINGNPLDNRKTNLRICTHAENMKNMKLRADNSSGYKGVSWDKYKKKWVAEIWSNGKKYHIGRFDDITEAAIARDNKAIELHGEFAASRCIIKITPVHID